MLLILGFVALYVSFRSLKATGRTVKSLQNVTGVMQATRRSAKTLFFFSFACFSGFVGVLMVLFGFLTLIF